MLVWGLGEAVPFHWVREFSTVTQFQFSAKASGSQVPIPPAVVDLKSSSFLCGHWAQVLNAHMATYTHTHFKNIIKNMFVSSYEGSDPVLWLRSACLFTVPQATEVNKSPCLLIKRNDCRMAFEALGSFFVTSVT